MAVYSGQIAPFYYEEYVPFSMPGVDLPVDNTFHGFVTDAVATTYSDTQPITIATDTQTGYLSHSYKQDYYYRVHVIPPSIDFGFIAGTRQSAFSLWNAWFNSRTLETIDASNADGVSITTTTPETFGALTIHNDIVTVSIDGTLSLDAIYSFTFDNAEVSTLGVTGYRAVVWSFRPNWRQPVIERLSYQTDILPSRSAVEQVIQLREHPRVEYEFFQSSFGDDQALIDTVISAHQGRVFVLPLFMDVSVLTASVLPGAVTLPLDTQSRRFSDSEYAVILQDASSYEVVSIAASASDSITLADPLVSAWTAGTRVYPAIAASLQSTLGRSLPIPDWSDGNVTFLSTSTVPTSAAELDVDTYRGSPVLNNALNLRVAHNADHARQLFVFDTQHGARSWEDATGEPDHRLQGLQTLETRADVAALRAFFAARAGRVNPIWVPLPRTAMRLKETILQDASTMRIHHIRYSALLAQMIGRRDIEITLTDGSVYRRRIADSSEIDTTTEELVVDTAFDREVTVDDVLHIRYLQLMRMDTDTLELAHHTSEVAETTLAFRGKRDDL